MPPLVPQLPVHPPERIFAAGFAASGLTQLTRAFPGGVATIDVSNIEETDFRALQPGSQDVFILDGDSFQEERTRWLQGRLAQVSALPTLARVSRNDAVGLHRFLRLGFDETYWTVKELPLAVARASARRAAAHAETGLHPTASGGGVAGRFEGLFPNLYDWIYVINVAEDGAFTFETVNPPLGAGSGFLNPDFCGRRPEDCLSKVSGPLLCSHFAAALAAGRPLQFEEEHSVDGRPRSFRTTLTPIRNKWGRLHRIAAISRDITALKEAQAALWASEERLNLALEGTQQSLWDWDLTSGAVFRSPRWFSMLDREPAEVGPTLLAGLEQIHPDDRAQAEGAMNAHLEGRQARFQAEYRLQTRMGDWIWVFDAGKVVAWDAEGQPSRVAGMCTDITERRRAEESLRALVGGVVHEIRNPVYGIFINLDALEATFGEEPRYRPFVFALRESAERIASLMNDLKDYGEPRTLNPEPCHVLSLLQESARACEGLVAERASALRLDIEESQLVLPMNARRMHQVFRNLFENALQHSPMGKEVFVAGRREQVEGHEWGVFTVEDQGPGFAPDAMSRAFEPFFTRRKGGTGLGLSIVKRVVEEHGGTIELANRAAGGAIITVKLPAPRHWGFLLKEAPDV
jgi:PAS domain S-box-containing protein